MTYFMLEYLANPLEKKMARLTGADANTGTIDLLLKKNQSVHAGENSFQKCESVWIKYLCIKYKFGPIYLIEKYIKFQIF